MDARTRIMDNAEALAEKLGFTLEVDRGATQAEQESEIAFVFGLYGHDEEGDDIVRRLVNVSVCKYVPSEGSSFMNKYASKLVGV